jgi:glucose-1-phosphate cytidylyltransferase
MVRKAVILAGGMGTRLSEETVSKPKPMVEIGGRPILWHIMKIYLAHGISEFVILLGYKGYMIKEFFHNYFLHQSDVTYDMENSKTILHNNECEPWKVTLVHTGDETQTGGRLKRAAQYLSDEDDFCLTYGDGVCDVDISALIAFHEEKKKTEDALVTITAVRPPGRFGALELDGEQVTNFREKPLGDRSWINGGFFVCSTRAIDYIEGDMTRWEEEPLEKLAKERRLVTYKHQGFWQCMDTLRDKQHLEKLWQAGDPAWKLWD